MAFLQDTPKSKDARGTLRRIWSYLERQRWVLVGVLGLVILPSAVSPCLRIPLFWLAFKRLPFPLYLRMALAALRDTGVLTLVFHTWELASLPAGVAPAWLVRPSGPELVGRLRRLLLALRPLARFETCGAIAARAVGGASPDGKVAYP